LTAAVASSSHKSQYLQIVYVYADKRWQHWLKDQRAKSCQRFCLSLNLHFTWLKSQL